MKKYRLELLEYPEPINLPIYVIYDLPHVGAGLQPRGRLKGWSEEAYRKHFEKTGTVCTKEGLRIDRMDYDWYWVNLSNPLAKEGRHFKIGDECNSILDKNSEPVRLPISPEIIIEIQKLLGDVEIV
jgi:hypothetical protein